MKIFLRAGVPNANALGTPGYTLHENPLNHQEITMYEIKNLKKFKGHEGEPCAQGTLSRDGKRVAEWSDDSHGGPFRIDFAVDTERTAFVEFAKTYLPSKRNYDGKPYDLTEDACFLIENAAQEMVNDALEYSTVTRLVNKGMCYRAIADGTLETYSVNRPYTAKNVKALEDKLGASLVEIVNRTRGLPLIDEEVAALAATNAYYKKACKTRMLFTVKAADGKLEVRSTGTPYTPKAAAAMRAKFGADFVEVINERYL